ncbi:hypothetical protein [Variovorax jilinensis]|uniref:hypothetical protein n=1 Tax=Variovorax jilinensis TaxID=3053513 RepID=UPI002576E439|nr:hypothetical protein [Variovorax sp. J22P168]
MLPATNNHGHLACKGFSVALRDVSLTVLELEPGEFHWVLMEATAVESEMCLGFRPIDCSTRGLSDYAEALIQGAAALRVLQGVAPFGRPLAPVGIGESGPADYWTGAASSSPNEPDSCMFTTDLPAF